PRVVVVITETNRGVQIGVAAEPRAVTSDTPAIYSHFPIISQERAIADIARSEADAQAIVDEPVRAERNARGLDVIASGAIAVTDIQDFSTAVGEDVPPVR